jgi:hypothetical protein
MHYPNEYRYCPNPINWCDPLGLFCGATGCKDNCNYILEDANGEVVYTGITMQAPEKRLYQHQQQKPTVVSMTIIAEHTGPSKATNRQSARALEGSLLTNVYSGDHDAMGTAPTNPAPSATGLLNKTKKNGEYYHSMTPASHPAVYQPPATTGNNVNNPVLDPLTGLPKQYF